MVPTDGIEPPFKGYKSIVLPLYYAGMMVGTEGVEPLCTADLETRSLIRRLIRTVPMIIDYTDGIILF